MTVQGHSRAEWDVFVSYSSSDAREIGALVPALRAAGLRVFVDDTSVDDFASITATITEALAKCKVLLAFYSADYPQRRACQWELTYAYLTGQNEGDPRRRTLVVNPEPVAEHVHPVELRDAKHWPWPATEEALGQLAERVARHAESLTAPMGDLTHAPTVPWLPAPARTGSVHFVNRLAEQWRIHTALHRHRTPLVAQSGAGRAAQLRGMPGLGKSLLAQEYALHFSSAFPGGVFWFDLHRCAESSPPEVMASYAEQVSTVLSALGLDVPSASLPELLSHLAIALGEENAPCLWVVDGVPNGLHDEQLHLLRGPHLLSATLITTRSLHYTSFAECVDLSPLSDADGFRLLTSQHPPAGDLDRASATALVRDVDGHPQALDLLAGLAAHGDFAHLRNRFHSPGTDVLTASRVPAGNGASTPLAAAAVPLSRPLYGHAPTDDVLRLFALASPAPMSQSALENVLATLSSYDPWDVTAVVAEATETLLGSGTLRPDPAQSRSWTVHPLTARAVRRHDTDTARQEDLRRMLLHTLTPTLASRGSGESAPAPLRAESTAPPAWGVSAPRGTVERAAAFDLQVELVTRVGVQPLATEQGSLREALTSLYSLFATTRDVLHRVAGETAGPIELPGIAASLANELLRPFLATWHAALQEHEAVRPADVGPIAHERRWERSAEMRAELAALNAPLTSAAKKLATLCGTDLLAPPSAAARPD
ncbi:TIR domain-containing protein [Streptomyces sp. Amel2xB2]|uniref:TIR domain-containing protein n=1 Tax=Streptomyces sp. Amel2xB2 TaxID=1305829 RepID=UPI000DBFE195|nr:TIR domain-containing protein [Streptomyces sp. Amel2xB2]RAJ68769.1 TIR domain-containing protein [Streptomyces sp. Amel2xB2]